jgi:DNA invertase Pin-like site-specific DNA recombinase
VKQYLPCAIYTRKSTEEGLEQDFNSLDAQREACEAYITSQKALGWKCAGCYDDGGYSGGNMERPGLQKLMQDIGANRIRVVVVYKVDRLTRSLADFAKLVEQFDAHEVSFVSVTQAFNTTTSMGRLTLNVLLSFAQFEREVTGERIRDKIAASKRKGMWMGGNPPIGYQPKDRTLVVDEPEAERVRYIYWRYLQLEAVNPLKADLDAKGWKTNERNTKRQIAKGGRPFTRGHLYRILSNPIYVGRVPYNGESFPGNHPAIVDEEMWQAVQRKLAENLQGQRQRTNAAQPSLLAGLIYGPQGQRLTPSHANVGPKRYRYYIDQYGTGDEGQKLRMPAQQLEALVLSALCAALRDEHRFVARTDGLDAGAIKRRLASAKEMASRLEVSSSGERVSLIQDLVARVDVRDSELSVQVRMAAIEGSANDATLTVDTPMQLKRSGMAVRLVVPGTNASATRQADPRLVGLLEKARKWFGHLSSGRCSTVQEVASLEGVTGSHATRVMYLAFLAPDIVQSIVKGEQPIELDSTRLMKSVPLPEEWGAQRRLLGFAS